MTRDPWNYSLGLAAGESSSGTGSQDQTSHGFKSPAYNQADGGPFVHELCFSNTLVSFQLRSHEGAQACGKDSLNPIASRCTVPSLHIWSACLRAGAALLQVASEAQRVEALGSDALARCLELGKANQALGLHRAPGEAPGWLR